MSAQNQASEQDVIDCGFLSPPAGLQGALTAPLISRDDTEEVPATWCVVVCEQGCQQSWTVDTADFDPPLTVEQVEDLLTPLLLSHETEHRKGW